MALIKTEAIVLKSDNYREKSKILTLYTKSHGKIRAIAKGVRDTKSKWGGALQSMAHLNVMFYFHENRTLHLISSAEYVELFQSLVSSYDKMKIGFRIVEMVNKTTMENHVISGLFNLIADSLKCLDNATKNFINVLFYFELRLTRLLGIGLEPDVIEQITGSRKDRSIADLKGNKYNTGVLNPKAQKSVQYKDKDVKFLIIIANASLENVVKVELTKAAVHFIDEFLDLYFREHFDNIGYSNTKKVFKSKVIYA